MAQYLGAQLVFAEGWQGVVASAIIAAIVVWLLIVLLRLFFVAPYQLWKLRYKPEYKKQLQEFYISGTELLQRNLPKDISAEDFESYVNETKQWVNETAHWIQENMSYPARVRFLDRTGIISAQYSAQVNERHGKSQPTYSGSRKIWKPLCGPMIGYESSAVLPGYCSLYKSTLHHP